MGLNKQRNIWVNKAENGDTSSVNRSTNGVTEGKARHLINDNRVYSVDKSKESCKKPMTSFKIPSIRMELTLEFRVLGETQGDTFN